MIQKLKKCSFAAIKHGTCAAAFVRMEVSNIDLCTTIIIVA